MKTTMKQMLCVLTLGVAASGAMAATSTPSNDPSNNSSEARSERMDSALHNYRAKVERNQNGGNAQRAEASVVHGAEKAGHAVKRGAQKTGEVVGEGLQKGGNAVERAGHKLERKSDNGQ